MEPLLENWNHLAAAMRTAIQTLATGADPLATNPADAAMRTQATAQIGDFRTSLRNTHATLSLLHTAAGGLQAAVTTVQALEALAVQGATGTVSTADRQTLAHQAWALIQQLGRIAADTAYNGHPLFQGTDGPVSNPLLFDYQWVTSQMAPSLAGYAEVVLSGGLQAPTSGDAATIQSVIAADQASTAFYGYVPLNHGGVVPLSTVETEIQQWKALGVHGIFVDTCGNSWGISPSERQQVVQFIHSTGLAVTLNTYNPENSVGVGLQLGDAMLAENWFSLGPPSGNFIHGVPQTVQGLRTLAQQGVSIWSVTTPTGAQPVSTAADVAFGLAGIHALIPEVAAAGVEPSNYGATIPGINPASWNVQAQEPAPRVAEDNGTHAVPLSIPAWSPNALRLNLVSFATPELTRDSLPILRQAMTTLSTYQAQIGGQVAAALAQQVQDRTAATATTHALPSTGPRPVLEATARLVRDRILLHTGLAALMDSLHGAAVRLMPPEASAPIRPPIPIPAPSGA